MINEFWDYIESFDFEETGIAVIQALRSLDNDVEIDLILNPCNGKAEQFWRLHFTSVVDYNIQSKSQGYCPDLHRDHVLLWPYKHPTATLTFKGFAETPLLTIGKLYEKHIEQVGEWYPLHQFLNQGFQTRLVDLLSGGYGVFAEGPLPLIEVYQQVLKKHGLDANIMIHPLQRWDGEKFIENSKDLFAFMIGQSYVIAEGIEAHKVTDGLPPIT